MDKIKGVLASIIPSYYKSAIVKYFLKKYIGVYVVNIDVDKLNFHLNIGSVHLKNLELNINSLNEVVDQLNLPFIFIDGFIGEISLIVPWGTIFTDNCFLEINDFKFTLRPKPRLGDVSLVDSMIESMASSQQMATECVQISEEDFEFSNSHVKHKSKSFKSSETNSSNEYETEKIDAIANCAKAIDTIFCKIQVRFINTMIRIEHLPESSLSGVALEVQVNQIDYFDEAGFDKESTQRDQNSDAKNIDSGSLFSKKFLIEGISIYTDEFPSEKYSSDEGILNNKHPEKVNSDDSCNADLTVNETLNDSSDSFNSKYSNEMNENLGNTFFNTSSILLVKFLKNLEIKLQLRKNDSKRFSGPKINIEMNFGYLISFLSPRQIHLLIELLNSIISPEKIESVDITNKEKHDKQKPMNHYDFKTVEQDFIKDIPTSNLSHALTDQGGWSSPPDVVLKDEIFLPFYQGVKGKPNPMTSSTLTDISDFESSFMSTASTNIYNNPGTRKDDILTNFKIRIGNVCIVLLHEDILTPSDNTLEAVTESSLTEMNKKVDTFFGHFNFESNCESSYQEFLFLKEKSHMACFDSHLRLIVSGFLIEGSEKLFSNKWELNTDITANWLEIKECLNESENESPKMSNSDIFSFLNLTSYDNLNCFHLPVNPKLQINIHHYIHSGRSGRKKNANLEFTIKLDECLTEIDISIIDRLNALLNVQNITHRRSLLDDMPAFELNNETDFHEMMEEVNSKLETITKVSIKSNLLRIKLFFPIPDLRPASNMNRVPYWKRNVRKEVLLIDVTNALIKSNLSNANIEILSSDIQFFLQETNEISPVPIMRASSAKDVEKGFNPIRICIKNFPAKNCADLNSLPVPEQEDMSKSTMGFLAGINDSSATLFNKRKVAFQNHGNITEITIPSNGKEIYQFVNETLKNIQLDIDISLTDVKLILPSKHVYEIIYNRIVSDLLLWTPSAPKCLSKMSLLNTVRDDFSRESTLVADSLKPLKCKFLPSFNFSDCFSECGNDSINDSYYNKKSEKLSRQTFIGLTVKIRNAAGSFHTPYKDEDGKVVPGKYGNISFLFDKGLIFIASGYQGDENAVQGSITLNTINIYHQPNNTLSHSPTELNSDFLLSIKNMNSILHQSDALYKIGGGTAPVLNYKDCFTLCFKSCLDDKRNENLFEVAGTLYNLTLSYYMTNSSESWISQIQDMFNIEDYPVEGYSLPETVTEMNFNFEFCSIDYKPLNLPLKTYITVDSLAISSNLAVKGNTSIITFIVEDAGLFLSKKLSCNKINLKNDYICVLDIGVLELCMKFDCSSSDIPVTELSISNNIIHIRTCSDSCKALMELLIYFSNCGDLVQEPTVMNDNHHNVIIESSHTEEMICSQHSTNVLSKHDLVANMMQEAMIEAAISDIKTNKKYKNSITPENDTVDLKVDEFFFPGESKTKNLNKFVGLEDSVNIDIIKALREAQIDDSSAIFQSDYKLNDDDEFCVLEDIPGTGIKSPSGKPKAKYIVSQPICIKEGYFDPTTNKPVSEKHKYSPVPICKYNLQEMSIVWLMYGGKDFTSARNDDDDDERNGNRQSRNISIISNSPHSSPELSSRQIKGLNVTFSNGDASITSGRNSPHSLHASPTTLLRPNANLKWFSLGGPERHHDTLMEISLNKIKFKYEMYSEDAPFVSQHYFAINDIVIRDCLLSSKFNKFLYQLSSESFPKQSSSNMIQIKAVCKQSDPSFTYESNLSISCRPIRLNIDQDALMFLCQFCDDILKTDRISQVGHEEKPMTKFSYQPVLSLTCEDKSNSNSTTSTQNSLPKSDCKSSDVAHSNSPIYFRSVVFSPDVPIRIDYHGKHIDINSQFGPIAGLIIGLGQLNHSELRLKRIQIKTGVLGIDKLVSCLTNEWLNDIKKNQLPSILGGVGPMHSFVKLGSGIKDLFWLPIEQYHKDGRVIRGLQRGTSAFTSSSAYAILDLTSRFVGTIQSTAETMYDMVSSGPSVKNKAYKVRRGQPKDIREGVSAAYGLVRNGLGDTASSLIKVAAEEHSHKGVSGAVGGLLRQIPPSVVQPIIIASEATCTVIGGMTNQLVPEAGKEAAEKWKS